MQPDRSAIMRQAWREWRDARRRGWDRDDYPDPWTWRRCLKFAAAQARARRHSFSAVEAAMRSLVAEHGECQ